MKKRLHLAIGTSIVVAAIAACWWLWWKHASLTTGHPAPPYSPGQYDRKPPPLRYPFHQDGKIGYIDDAGKVVIPASFDRAWGMSEGYGVVKVGEKLGLVDHDGTVLIAPRYRWDGGLEPVKEGLVRVMTAEGRYGFVDPRGGEVIPAEFDYALDFSEGLAPAMVGKRFGYVDRAGRFVIRPAFDYAWPFREGLACVQVKDRLCFIDRKGAPAFAGKYGYAYSFSEGLAAVNQGGHPPLDYRDEIGGKWGFIDRTGKVVIAPRFDQVWSFSDGRAAVRVGPQWEGEWGFIGRDGEYVVEPRYRWVEEFSEGLAVFVSDAGKYGFIDRDGRVVIEPQFDHAYGFKGGLAEVWIGHEKGRKYGYIDNTGRFIWNPTN